MVIIEIDERLLSALRGAAGRHAGTAVLPAAVSGSSIDSLALFSLLLVVGLLIGEWLRARFGWPKMIGYVLAGTFFGPSLLGWISIEALAQARPIADAALGLLMLEVGRRLDLRWLRQQPDAAARTLGRHHALLRLHLCLRLLLVGRARPGRPPRRR
jgi:predicted Kef-type K+ transport protein